MPLRSKSIKAAEFAGRSSRRLAHAEARSRGEELRNCLTAPPREHSLNKREMHYGRLLLVAVFSDQNDLSAGANCTRPGSLSNP